MHKGLAALVAVGAVLAATRIGARHSPASNHPRAALWYGRLRKPSYTPPGPAIGAAWIVLDGLLCVTGYRLLTAPASPARTSVLALWASNLAGLAGWPWLFFGRKELKASLAGACAMMLSALGGVVTAARVDRPAALAGLPLVGWLGFATLLSEEIYRRN